MEDMLGNRLGNWVENVMGTHWEPGENEKNPFPLPPPPQNLKGKESKPP
jgi:hypothetical protein